MNDLYSRALALCDLGYSVIPIRWRDKRPDGQALLWVGSVDAGGYPTWNTYKDRPPTNDELRLWFALSGRRNLGVVTGYNNLTVIDFDSFDAWDAWEELAGDCELLASHSYRVLTARGVHVYLRTKEPMTSYSVGQIDIKARWGYVLGEGSVHPTGWVYRGNGGIIPTLPNVAGLFGLERTEGTVSFSSKQRIQYDDPWEAAENAVGPVGPGKVEAIKEQISVADILGISQPRARMMIRCPLHTDKAPSFAIYPDGHWHCFGCNRGGDVITLYAELHAMNTREAILELSTRLGEE